MISILEWLNKIDRKSCFYDSQLLSNIIPSNQTVNGYSVLEYPKDINRLVTMLNEGQIQLTYLELDEIEDGLELPEEYFEQYVKFYPKKWMTSYITDEKIWIRYQAWRWLQQLGGTNIEFKRGQLCMIAHDLNIVLKTSIVQPKEIIKQLEKGVNSFCYMPTYDMMFQFTSTPLMKKALEKKKNNEKDRKKLFLKSESPNSMFSIEHDFTILSSPHKVSNGDIICWQQGDKAKLKGLVVKMIEPRQSVREIYEDYVLKRKMCFYESDFDYLHAKDIDPKQRVLVIYSDSLKKKNVDYYAPRTSEVEVVASLSFMLEYATWYVKHCGVDITIKMIDDRNENFNAAYIAPEHSILIHRINMWNTIFHNYLHYDMKPEDTMAIIISHELGHSYPTAIESLGEQFSSLVEETNHLLKLLREEKEKLNECNLTDLHSSYEKWVRLQKNLLEYHEIELNAEFDAWQFGRIFIPPYLLEKFNQDNLSGYERYAKDQYNLNDEVADIGAQIKNAMYFRENLIVE